MTKGKVLKTKEDRLREGIHLLTQLRTAHVKENMNGYQQLKQMISAWVETGNPQKETIPFPEHGREAIVELPQYNNKAAGIHFNVKSFY